MIEARWLPIPEAPNYLISDQGEVRDSSGKTLPLDGGRANLFRMGMRLRVNVRRKVNELFPDIAEALLNEPGEVWKPVPGHAGYEVSSHARVRRGSRITAHGLHGATRAIGAKILKTSRNNGYLVAYLGIQNSRKAKMIYVEKIVFELFPELTPVMENLEGEEWRDILGYEGLYQVSNLGRIASLPRTIDDGHGRNRHIRSRIRELGAASGYPKVELARDGSTKTFLVHRLVAQAFVPNPNGLDTVHHKNEDRTDARAENLEWVTRAGNVQDWFNGRPHKIDEALVAKIAAEVAAGKSPAEILAALPGKRAKKSDMGGSSDH